MARVTAAWARAVVLAAASFLTAADPQPALGADPPTPEQTRANDTAVAYLNELRQAAGLDPVVADLAAMRAALNHTRYQQINATDPTLVGLDERGVPRGHSEVAGKPGFTGTTPQDRYLAAGGKADWYCRENGGVVPNGDPRQEIFQLMGAPIHRDSLLGDVEAIGFGAALPIGETGVLVCRSSGRKVTPRSVPWPHDGMRKVPLRFRGELPDPSPDPTHTYGYPITVTRSGDTAGRISRLTLRDERGPVPVVPARTLQTYETGYIYFPVEPLRPATRYTVDATFVSSAGTEQLAWSFTTQNAPPTIPRPAQERNDPGGLRIAWDVEGIASGFVVDRDLVVERGSYRVERSWTLPSTARFFIDPGPFPAGIANYIHFVRALDENAQSGHSVATTHVRFIDAPIGPVWHSQWVAQSPYPTMAPGEVRAFWVEFVNLGNQPWIRGSWSTEAHLALNGDDQRPATAWGMDPGTWLAKDRLATHDQAVVAPGEIGRFSFRVRAPVAPGEYVLNLRPVIDGITWMEDNGVFWPITVVAPYHSRWVDQSSYPTLARGDVATVTVRFRNTGTATWIKGTTAEVRLGLDGDDRTFSQGGMALEWPFPERPAIQAEASVPPSGIATFTFKIRGATAGTYRLHVRPVIDGVAWLEDDGVFLVVTVR